MPFLLLISWSLLTAEPYRHVLIGAEEEPEATWSISSEDVTPSSPHKWRVSKQQLHSGKQDGVDIVTVDNGVMQMIVVPTRGMGIWQVIKGDVRLGWDSPVKEVVHPKFVNVTARGGLGWLDGFGEWMCRCGLENNGHPGQDVIIDNTGAKSTVDLTLHGKQANLPAQRVELIVDPDPPFRLRLVGRVDERMMHGPKFELSTEISTDPGSSSFRIADTVTNASVLPTEFQLLYHCNFGSPLLEKDSRLVAPLKRVTPFNDRAAEGDIKTFATFAGPTAGFVEQVYCIEPLADSAGQTTVALVNANSDRGASMTYSVAALPYLTLWKNTAAVEDGYVTGIEPGTNYPYNRRLERAAGRVPKLEGGQKRPFVIDVALHSTKEEVAAALAGIAKIQGDQMTEFVDKPQVPAVDNEQK